MEKTVPRNFLRIGDYILTTSRSALACAIRFKSAGIRQTFNTRIASHAGIIYSLDGSDDPSCFFMAEMLQHLRSTSLREYEEAGFWRPWVVCVKRNPLYNDPAKRKALNDRIHADLQRAPEYDTRGIAEYIWPKIEDRPEDFYCSEYLRYQAQKDGGDIVHPKWRPEDDIPPCGIQWALNVSGVWVR